MSRSEPIELMDFIDRRVAADGSGIEIDAVGSDGGMIRLALSRDALRAFVGELLIGMGEADTKAVATGAPEPPPIGYPIQELRFQVVADVLRLVVRHRQFPTLALLLDRALAAHLRRGLDKAQVDQRAAKGPRH